MIKVWGVRWLWMKARNQKLEMFLSLNRARSPLVWQWRLNRLPITKWHHLSITDHQMTSPPDRWSPNDITSSSFSSPVPSSLVWFPPEQDYESTIPMSFLFIVSFKTGPSELLSIWSHFVYDVLFLYLINRVVPFTNSVFLYNNHFLNWCFWQ